jgi:DNA-binding MarR family transcriptional regulator
VRVRDLPLLAGVSKQAISMMTGIAGQQGLAVAEPDPAASRGKVVRLNPGGRRAQDACRRLLAAIEDGWQERFGPAGIRGLRQAPGRSAAGADSGVADDAGHVPPRLLGLIEG